MLMTTNSQKMTVVKRIKSYFSMNNQNVPNPYKASSYQGIKVSW